MSYLERIAVEAYQDGAIDDTGTGWLERLMYRHERWMYRGARPNRVAAFLNGVWARVGAAGPGADWSRSRSGGDAAAAWLLCR
jgi:hypothetical protein